MIADYGNHRLREVAVQRAHGGYKGSSGLIEVFYLQSYEHMGRAAFGCLPPCICQEELVDAWQPAFRASVGARLGISFELRRQATAGRKSCVLWSRVLPPAHGGNGSEFKLLSVSIAFDRTRGEAARFEIVRPCGD